MQYQKTKDQANHLTTYLYVIIEFFYRRPLSHKARLNADVRQKVVMLNFFCLNICDIINLQFNLQQHPFSLSGVGWYQTQLLHHPVFLHTTALNLKDESGRKHRLRKGYPFTSDTTNPTTVHWQKNSKIIIQHAFVESDFMCHFSLLNA